MPSPKRARTPVGRRRDPSRCIALFCLCVWAILHFGVASRLDRLARSVRDFGEGRTSEIAVIDGGDEVHELSLALGEMGSNLAERENQRIELERQVIESAESERRRIGHELHDGIGQQLGGLLMAANSLSRGASGECLSLRGDGGTPERPVAGSDPGSARNFPWSGTSAAMGSRHRGRAASAGGCHLEQLGGAMRFRVPGRRRGK